MKKETKVKIGYFAVSFTAYILYLTGKMLTSTNIFGLEYVNQSLILFPYFTLSIAVPYFAAGLIRLFAKPKYEVKIFYYILTLALVLLYVCTVEINKANFAVFKVIAGAAGLFMSMILHHVLNFPLDKVNSQL